MKPPDIPFSQAAVTSPKVSTLRSRLRAGVGGGLPGWTCPSKLGVFSEIFRIEYEAVDWPENANGLTRSEGSALSLGRNSGPQRWLGVG